MTGVNYFYVGRSRSLGVKRPGAVERIPNGRPFAYYLGKGNHDKGLRLHLHHIWPRGKLRKLI
jgi:hypothetical protein